MAKKVTKVTREQKRLARKAGFTRKAPKKPKVSAATHVKERWVERYNEWAKDLQEKAKEGKKEEDLDKDIRSAVR